jgi:hypothetical protein
MLRGPLGKENYKPKFSGHDTFPFRYAWLTKLAEFINENGSKGIKEFEKNKLANVNILFVIDGNVEYIHKL